MQDDTGLKRLLGFSWAYERLQDVAGAAHMRRWLAREYWRVRPGMRVIDIGCGPGSILDSLARDIHYVGIDLSESYIRAARCNYGDRGEFIAGDAAQLQASADPRLRDADLVMCTGLLHHLEDAQVDSLLRFARDALAPSGRLVCLEPTFLVHQSRFSRWLMAQDRGGNVRSEFAWRELVRSVFPRCDTFIATHLYRIPYIHIVIECGPGAPQGAHST